MRGCDGVGAMTLRDLTRRLKKAAAEQTAHRDQALGILVCEEALAAAGAKTYGVGAILLDPAGTVIHRGRNRVFSPHFRSDLHAEMVVLNAFEEQFPPAKSMRAYTLISSLEPCPMCLSRLLIAGVQTVKYLAPDEWGGDGHAYARPTESMGAFSGRPDVCLSRCVRGTPPARARPLSPESRHITKKALESVRRRAYAGSVGTIQGGEDLPRLGAHCPRASVPPPQLRLRRAFARQPGHQFSSALQFAITALEGAGVFRSVSLVASATPEPSAGD